MNKTIRLSKGLVLVGALLFTTGIFASGYGLNDFGSSVVPVATTVAKAGRFDRFVGMLPSRAAVTSGFGSACSAVTSGLSAAYRGCTRENAHALASSAKAGLKSVPGYCTKENAQMLGKAAYQVVAAHPGTAAAVAVGVVGAGFAAKYIRRAYNASWKRTQVETLGSLISAANYDFATLQLVIGNGAGARYDQLNNGYLAQIKGGALEKPVKKYGFEDNYVNLCNLFVTAREALANNITVQNVETRSNGAEQLAQAQQAIAGYKGAIDALQGQLNGLRAALNPQPQPVQSRVEAQQPAPQQPGRFGKIWGGLKSCVTVPCGYVKAGAVKTVNGVCDHAKAIACGTVATAGLSAAGYGVYRLVQEGYALKALALGSGLLSKLPSIRR